MLVPSTRPARALGFRRLHRTAYKVRWVGASLICCIDPRRQHLLIQFHHPCDGMGWGTWPLLKPAKAFLHVQIVVIPPVGQVFSLPLLSTDLIFKLLSRTLLQMILDVRDLGSIFFIIILLSSYYYYYSISYNFMPIYNTIAEPIPWA